ncbi:MAG: carboxymethylenebutenolidase [Solirubrobacteraceae bacterium]|nr:carboxymethylenebutenolidase [Solirubrobacteraceae bacterium]
MCFACDALPPDLPAGLVTRPPLAGGAAGVRSTLTSADGTEFSAYLAQAAEPRGAAVVILPDVRGLYRFYEELAERFADAGHHAIAFDYFGRTAGLGPRDDDFEYMPHVRQTEVARIQADAAAAVAHLRAEAGDTPVIAVGFCFGGFQAFTAAASDLDLAGVVGFYGALDGSRFGAASPAHLAAHMHMPVLGLFGGADEAIPADQIEQFHSALLNQGIEIDVVVYPGAPHSFFDRRQQEWAEASEDAWRRVLGFARDRGQAR